MEGVEFNRYNTIGGVIMIHRSYKSFLIITIILFSTTLLLLPQEEVVKNTDPGLRLKWYAEHEAMKKDSIFKNLPWQFLGPLNVSGRMTDVEVIVPKGKNYSIYIAAASGGVWKTQNEGTTWEPVFENKASTSIGNIAIAPSDQKTIWVGTGEANIYRSSQTGAGIYKSTDGGKTWQHMGLTDTNTISKIIIHPKNPDIVYVAASGHEWTDNSARGLYKTSDGGKTWEKIKFINGRTGAIDLVMDLSNPDTLYVSFWQRIRRKWNDPRIEKGYKWSGLYRTNNGGKNWTEINKGLPEAKYRGRIGIDLCRAKPNILYAFIDNYEIAGEWEPGDFDTYGRPKGGKIKGATVFRSDNSGSSWKRVSEENGYMENLSNTYGWVFGQIRVDPNNENRIYVMGLALNVSENGGKTFHPIGRQHGDHHGLWIDPDNSDYLVNVNDGGLAISYDGGKHFRTFANRLPLAQFFNVNYDMGKPFRVYGSVQDHGSYKAIVDTSRGRFNIPAQKWENAPGGEGSNHAIDPTDANTVYSAGFYGTLMRTDIKNDKTKVIVPKSEKDKEKFRGQWLAPFILSPHDPKVIYHGMNYIFKSSDRGETWKKISPDLSYNKKDMKGDIPYQTIFAISESPLKAGFIYAGTDDGRVWFTDNDGKNWKNITGDLPYRKWVSRIVASQYDLGTVYLTQNGKRDDDFTPYIWRSTNFGNTWESIVSNIPTGPVNVIREDPSDKNILYLGTDFGVYVSLNAGKKWHTLMNNLPTTYVQDLVVHPREDILIAATHGRGMYAIDIRYIQEMAKTGLNNDLFLFPPENAKLPKWRMWYWAGKKPGNFGFWLNSDAKVKIVITGHDGKTVRSIVSNGIKGFNFIKWDLRPDKPEKKNPFVISGIYKVKITAGKFSSECSIEVKK